MKYNCFFFGVVNHPSGPDLPQRHTIFGANLARRRGGVVHLRIAPRDPFDLKRCQLQLLRQDNPGAVQQSILKVGIQDSVISDNNYVVTVL